VVSRRGVPLGPAAEALMEVDMEANRLVLVDFFTRRALQ
jgi:hypothetical protein